MGACSVRLVVLGAVVCGGLFAGAQGQAAQTDEQDRVALTMFSDRMAQYAATRARLAEPLPAFDGRRDTWSLMLTRRYLASAIRAARPAARQGHVFSPLVAAFFREVITHTLPPGRAGGLGGGESEEDYVTLVVHEPVPDWAMQTLPPALLQALPPLPAAVEYRLVAPDLILWDVHAEILIDVLPGAFLENAVK